MTHISVPAQTDRPGTGRGIAFVLSALVMFTLMDALAKHLILSGYPALQVVWMRYVGQTALVAILILPRLGSALRTRRPFMQGLRSILQFSSSAFFFLALPHIGLAEATAITDLNPILITLGAGLFLGERIGPRRMAAIAVALVGALIIIRPGGDVFSAAALLPLACAFSFAGFALITRAMGEGDAIWTSLFYSALFGSLVTTALMPFVWMPVRMNDLAGFLGIGVLGTLGQLFFIRAYACAPATVIAPFGYTGILLATIWGFLFFGEWPDRATIIGALVIVGAGLYVWHRETRLGQRQIAGKG